MPRVGISPAQRAGLHLCASGSRRLDFLGYARQILGVYWPSDERLTLRPEPLPPAAYERREFSRTRPCCAPEGDPPSRHLVTLVGSCREISNTAVRRCGVLTRSPVWPECATRLAGVAQSRSPLRRSPCQGSAWRDRQAQYHVAQTHRPASLMPPLEPPLLLCARSNSEDALSARMQSSKLGRPAAKCRCEARAAAGLQARAGAWIGVVCPSETRAYGPSGSDDRRRPKRPVPSNWRSAP